MENEGDDDATCYWFARSNPERNGKSAVRLGNERTSGDHPDYSTFKIG